MINDPEELKKKRLVKMWLPILEELHIPEAHHLKVAEYAHLQMELEKEFSIATPPGKDNIFPSNLPMSLKVLSRLNLDKIDFMPGPTGVLNEGEEDEQFLQVGTHQVTIDTEVQSGREILLLGLDEMYKIEKDLIEALVEYLSERVEKNSLTIFFQVVSGVKRIPDTSKFAAATRFCEVE